jgi:hypothetical protein
MTTNRNWKSTMVALLGFALGAACTPSGTADPTFDPNVNPADPPTSGDNNTTFDHPSITQIDPFQLLQRMQTEGPPEAQAVEQSCAKVSYLELGNMLKSRGVNMNATAATSAAVIYKNGTTALGVADYPSRVPESTDITTSGVSKEYDIWAAAAPEIITAMPTLSACMVNGTGTSFYDSSGKCTAAGIQCLTGKPASQTAVDLCNQIVAGASTPAIGKNLAVASIAASNATCQ